MSRGKCASGSTTPALPHPIFGALIEDTGNGTARLIWRRDRKDDG